ncbi:MAG TPA: hypothetical protein VHD35_01085 [Chitinophagaceae bacterium]|nr:hypothetical protein [Chitinophagaceae bacterium]
MSDGGYKIRNKVGIHFITFAAMDGLHITMSGIATFGGPIGFGASLIYFAGRAFDWW